MNIGYLASLSNFEYTVAKELDKPDGCHRFGKCCQKLGKDLPVIQTNIHPARILELNGHNWQKLPIY